MELEKLKRFFTVVECMSVSKAAKALYITRPTLSKSISSLEDELGITLFRRENNALVVTDAGRLLYEQGQKLMERADAMMANISKLDSPTEARLSVAFEQFYHDNIFLMLKELNENGEYRFSSRTITNDFNEILQMVSSGNTDMGVICRASIEDMTKEFSAVRLFTDRVVLVTSNTHRFADRKTIKCSELKDEDIVYPECSQNMSRIYYGLCSAAGQKPEQMRFMVRDDYLSNVKWGFSVCLCHMSSVDHDLPDCFRFIDIEDMDTSFPIVLFWRKDNSNPHIRHFLSTVEKYFPDCERI